jgi:hypothetical protein
MKKSIKTRHNIKSNGTQSEFYIFNLQQPCRMVGLTRMDCNI